MNTIYKEFMSTTNKSFRHSKDSNISSSNNLFILDLKRTNRVVNSNRTSGQYHKTNASSNSIIYTEMKLDPSLENKEHFDKLNELDEVQKLKKLFLQYSSNENKLNSQKFLKLLSDAKILNKNFDSKYADILFFTASRSKSFIVFNEFCELIVKISEIKFPFEFVKNQSKALEKLMEQFLFTLLDEITEPQIQEENNKFKFTPEIFLPKMNTGSNKHYILKHFYCISKIYDKYFPWENLNVSNYQKSKLSEKTFNKFCKDFDISPNIVSLTKTNEIFQNVIMSHKIIFNIFDALKQNEEDLEIQSLDLTNKGTYFTLYHLISSLYLISVHNMCSLSNFKDNQIINHFSCQEDASKFIF